MTRKFPEDGRSDYFDTQNNALTFPREARHFRNEGFEVVSFPIRLATNKLIRRLKTERLKLAKPLTGDDMQKQLTEAAFDFVDYDNITERQYCDTDVILDVQGNVIGSVLVRRGKEHGRIRRFCAGIPEVIDPFLKHLPKFLDYPTDIHLVLRASDYNPDKLNQLFEGSYLVDGKSEKHIMRALLTKDRFQKAEIPVNEATIVTHRILPNYGHIDELFKDELKRWFKSNTDDESSYKGRNLRTNLYCELLIRGHSHKRIAIAGISAVNRQTGVFPLVLSADLVVAKEFRGRKFSYLARWLPYFYLFDDENNQNAVIAIDFNVSNPASSHIFLDKLHCEKVSEQLYVTMHKQ